jgi:hypothetical protein
VRPVLVQIACVAQNAIAAQTKTIVTERAVSSLARILTAAGDARLSQHSRVREKQKFRFLVLHLIPLLKVTLEATASMQNRRRVGNVLILSVSMLIYNSHRSLVSGLVQTRYCGSRSLMI